MMGAKGFPERIEPAAQGDGGDEPLVRLREVTKVYPTAAGEVVALAGVSAEFRRGEFAGVIGKSGAGKSTLANMISGVDRLTSGEVWVNGVAVHKLPEDELARWRGRHVGVVYQSFELIGQLSLLDNVMLPMDLCGYYERQRSYRRAMQLLEMLEIADHAHKPPGAISGGQQQRVAIARALANDPDLIVADEPTGNLDSTTGEVIFEIFAQLAARGKTVVMVTHEQSYLPRFNHVLRLVDGKIMEDIRL